MLCNEATEVEILSSSPDLFIEFVANSEWPGQGFKAKFEFQPVDETTTGTLCCVYTLLYSIMPCTRTKVNVDVHNLSNKTMSSQREFGARYQHLCV